MIDNVNLIDKTLILSQSFEKQKSKVKIMYFMMKIILKNMTISAQTLKL